MAYLSSNKYCKISLRERDCLDSELPPTKVGGF